VCRSLSAASDWYLNGGVGYTYSRTAEYVKARYQWPSGVRRGSAADRFLGLRVRVPPGNGCFCCSVRTKDRKPRQSEQTSLYKIQKANQKKIPPGLWMSVLCVVSNDIRQNAGQSRQSTKFEWSTNREQENTKKSQCRHIFVFFNNARVSLLQILTRTLKLTTYYLIMCFKRYLCSTGKARYASDTHIAVIFLYFLLTAILISGSVFDCDYTPGTWVVLSQEIWRWTSQFEKYEYRAWNCWVCEGYEWKGTSSERDFTLAINPRLSK
jgi:hypothetical protein